MKRRALAAVLAPLVSTLVSAVVLVGSSPAAHAALPEEITVKDGGSSPPSVNISKIGAEASWYWDSEQYVSTTVPHGFRTGHRLTVWFDVNGDAVPDGHYEMALGKVTNQKRGYLAKEQQFRLGGGWTHGGKKVGCSGSDGFPPESSDVRQGQRTITLSLDVWGCLDTPNPAGLGSGAWRVAVAVAKNGRVDMAPNHQKWSPYVAGWGPCDPSGGSCS